MRRKRAIRAAKMEGAPETSSGAITDATSVTENKQEGQEQPDLGQLSVGLPLGWQVRILLHL